MSLPLRLTLYLTGNILFAILLLLGSGSQSAPAGLELLYLTALGALCSAPILWLAQLNGRYFLLTVFMGFYFLFFGMADAIALMFGGASANSLALAGGAECAVLVGAACALVGYLFAARGRRQRLAQSPKDWPLSRILVVGLLLWTIGSASLVYFQVYVMPEKTSIASARALEMLGPSLTFVVMFANLVAPVGLLILACGYATARSAFWLLLIVAVIMAQAAIAFVTDIRGQALLPPLIVIMVLALKDARLPKTWIVACLVLTPIVFPILSAYRAEISGERGLSRTQAVNNLSKVVDIVVASVGHARPGEQQQSIFERASIKHNFDVMFAHTGVDRPFQDGRTLLSIPLAFVPRVIWPDKPSVETGRIFNHQFFGGSDDTYISPSHFGELYWNFGWPGIVAGMLIIGALLGFIASRTDLRAHFSVTRVLILLTTVQYLCWGFEGALGSYVSWLRSLAVIALLHLLLAHRRAVGAAAQARPVAGGSASGVQLPAVPHFLNVLR
jgi:hypothetical protein